MVCFFVVDMEWCELCMGGLLGDIFSHDGGL